MCVCVRIYMYVCVGMYVCVHIYVCMYVCMPIYIYGQNLQFTASFKVSRLVNKRNNCFLNLTH